MRKFGKVAAGMGTLLTLLAVGWWAKSYEPYGLEDSISCLYSDSLLCGVGTTLTDIFGDVPSYEPALFWAGAGMVLVGAIVMLSSRD